MSASHSYHQHLADFCVCLVTLCLTNQLHFTCCFSWNYYLQYQATYVSMIKNSLGSTWVLNTVTCEELIYASFCTLSDVKQMNVKEIWQSYMLLLTVEIRCCHIMLCVYERATFCYLLLIITCCVTDFFDKTFNVVKFDVHTNNTKCHVLLHSMISINISLQHIIH